MSTQQPKKHTSTQHTEKQKVPTAAEIKEALGLQGFARKPGSGRGRPYNRKAPADQPFHRPR